MRRGTKRVLMVLALTVVLSLGLAASAMAAPSFTGVTPANHSNTASADFSLLISGSNLSEITDIDYVTLYQQGPPYDVIWTDNPTVVPLLPNTVVTCDANTYGEHQGVYNVEIGYYWGGLLGQPLQTSTIYGAFTVTQPPPPPGNPEITSLSPAKVVAGAAGFNLTVTGANFQAVVNPSVVMWNSTALVTTNGFPPASSLSAAVPASLVATAGTAMITVVNPNLGGGVVSNAIGFSITTAAPVLSGLSPASTWAKLVTPPAVVLTGSGFVSGSTAVVNGVSRAATFVSSTQLSVQLTAADIATAGSFTIAVSNPAPGGGTSAAQTFTVNAETTAPVTVISGADTAWHNLPVTLTIAATDSQSGVQKTMFGIGTTPPWTQLSGTSLTVPGPMGGNPNGANVVSAYSIDNCGTSETPPVQVTVNICTTGPTTEAFAPSSVKKGKTLKLGYQADSITPTCSITFKITKSNGGTAKTINLGQKASNTRGNYSFTCKLAKGKYKVKVYSTDAAGNAQSSMTGDSFTVK